MNTHAAALRRMVSGPMLLSVTVRRWHHPPDSRNLSPSPVAIFLRIIREPSCPFEVFHPLDRIAILPRERTSAVAKTDSDGASSEHFFAFGADEPKLVHCVLDG